MRQAALIVFLFLAIAVALFAVQNAGPVTLRFGFWSVEMSLVVVVLVAAALGAVLASLLSLPGWFRDRRLLRQQSKELETLRASRPSTLPAPTASPEPQTPPPGLSGPLPAECAGPSTGAFQVVGVDLGKGGRVP